MTDPVTLKEALPSVEQIARSSRLHRDTHENLAVIIAAAREYLVFLEGPTDEDVRVADKALHDYEAGPRTTRNLARAALLAVAEDRSTG